MRTIDADALFRAMEDAEWYNNADRDEIAEKLVMDAPTIELKRKQGNWKYERMKHLLNGETRTVRVCSECDAGWFRYDMTDGVEDYEPNFCPNCGANMRGNNDEIDD